MTEWMNDPAEEEDGSHPLQEEVRNPSAYCLSE